MRRSSILTHSTRPRVIALVAPLLLLLCLSPVVSRAQSDLRISNLSVFLNDFDVTVQGVLLGAVPSDLHESLHSGVPVHVRFMVELWQQRFRNRLIQTRTIDRQVTYNPATKEYKVA